ncbi:MAG: protein kinase, partial [Pyrinomonadaceae bacterium]|nr:protein kinase [Pyrinomonadaceae bacterium]
YLARDPKINRDVAIKVLPAAFSADSERLRRFEQEAQAAGAINHPNILSIYDVDTHEGSPYVVSELLDGTTLREQLNGNGLPVRKSLDYTIQIASGLAAAHAKGIVHRDLKPENLFVARDGRLKILDFGLAKLIEEPDRNEFHTDLPTRKFNTDPGAILGTVGYMSPEQVRAERVDHRSDIFSLGTILYEMLSGKRAFDGASTIETLNAILKEDPPELSQSNSKISPALERVVLHCLEKNPDQRFQSARDVAFAVESLSGVTSGQTIAAALPVSTDRAKKREWLPWVIAAVLLLGLLGTLPIAYLRRELAQTPTAARFLIYPPDKTSFGGPFAVSPDGLRIVLRGTSEGKSLLWVRDIDSLAAKPLEGTDDAIYPFWSPDSRFIGFFSAGKLKKIEVPGGPALTLCDAPDGRGGTWNSGGVIVFAPSALSSLYQVSAAGGVPVPVTKIDSSSKEQAHHFPHFLPDGRHFLYAGRSGLNENSWILVGSLDSTETKRLMNFTANAVYVAPGYLLTMRQLTLVAQSFDPDKLELTGEPFPVAEGVDAIPGLRFGLFSISQTGVLVYRSGSGGNVDLAWFDRAGKRLGTLGPPGAYNNPSLSPDEKRLALSLIDPPGGLNADIWLIDLASGARTRLTFDPGAESSPTWKPDGSAIVFHTSRDGPLNLYQKAASGAGNEEPLLRSDISKNPTDWSTDGKFILYQEQNPKTGSDLWVLPLSGDQKPFPFLQTNSAEVQGQFSPNGKWIAYTSNESGTYQIYVRSFPSGGQWQISNNGGGDPKWRHDGKELFYISSDRKLMAVEVKGDGATFESSVPKALFEMRIRGLPGPRNYYVVSHDGQRFLVAATPEEVATQPMTVVLNWQSALKR